MVKIIVAVVSLIFVSVVAVGMYCSLVVGSREDDAMEEVEDEK